jgi:integration host factor subunit alpha
VLDELISVISSGEELKLSSFGTFSNNQKKQRIGRNPKTGVEVPIKPRTVLSFTASNLVKKEVNAALTNPPKKKK